MRDDLTLRQRQVLDWITETINQQSVAPSNREIASHFGFRSPKAVTDHLSMLQRKGYLRIHKDKARGIELIETQGIPVIGRVAAGSPIEAIENQENHLNLPARLFTAKPDYLLRVSGDSMVDAHILDGDLVAVRKTPTAESGQMVVARLNNEVTVKRLHIDGTTITLLPANANYSPIRINDDDFALEGVVCGVIRQVE